MPTANKRTDVEQYWYEQGFKGYFKDERCPHPELMFVHENWVAGHSYADEVYQTRVKQSNDNSRIIDAKVITT